MSDLDERAFREAAFAWLRAQKLVKSTFTRDDLSKFDFLGERTRLLGPYTGIWKPRQLSSALSISTAYVEDERKRPYQDGIGSDGMLRYKWRGTNPNQSDNVALRRAMERGDELIWFVGVGYVGSRTQTYEAIFPVTLVAEEPNEHQFVVQCDSNQMHLPDSSPSQIVEIAKKYNERIVKTRYHQPIFRSRVLQAYEQRCAVCRLPFVELLDAAHIKADSQGGSAHITNGLALCKIHHGAFDSNIMGISPDYVVRIRESVLQTFDGPTLQHALKEMEGETLRQLPMDSRQMPDRELLAERFAVFSLAS
jgi:putative restriction endonuclease